jgi:hypothetical protein
MSRYSRYLQRLAGNARFSAGILPAKRRRRSQPRTVATTLTPTDRVGLKGEKQKMIDTCVLVTGVQIAAALLGIAAAILWLGGSLTKTPKRIPEGPLLGSLFDVFDDIHVSLAKQSRRNAQAAARAAGAAILQTIFIWAPTCMTMRW